MLAAAVAVLVVLLFVAGVLITRRQREASTAELGRLIGRVVEVSSMGDQRGPYVESVEGTLVVVDRSALVLRPNLDPISPRFSRMVTKDGSLRIPLREVSEVECAGQVVRVR